MAVKITQCHGHMPLSGRRFGSFAGKTATAVATGDGSCAWAHRPWQHPPHAAAAQSSAWSFSLPVRRLSLGGFQ